MYTRRDVALDRFRKSIGRTLRPIVGPRHGYRYAARRGIAAQMQRVARAGPTPSFAERNVDDLVSLVPGAVVHEIHPAWHADDLAYRVHGMRPWIRRHKPPWTSLAMPPMRVLDIPGGAAFVDGAVGLDPDALLVDVPGVYGIERRELLRRADSSRRTGIVHLDGTTATLLQLSPFNFAHCMVQGIPRIDLLRAVVDLAAVDHVLVNEGAPPLATTVLAKFGVAPERVIRVTDPGPVYVCERLLVPTPVPELGAVPDWAAGFLDSLVRESMPPANAPRRFFVVRPGAVRRQIANESEVRASLHARGFAMLAMEDYALSEQAALFASAEFIAAGHGAALANLVFAQPGTRVVELMPVYTMNWCYGQLGARRGLEYDVLLGTEPALPPPFWGWQTDADQVVDVGALEAILDRS